MPNSLHVGDPGEFYLDSLQFLKSFCESETPRLDKQSGDNGNCKKIALVT